MSITSATTSTTQTATVTECRNVYGTKTLQLSIAELAFMFATVAPRRYAALDTALGVPRRNRPSSRDRIVTPYGLGGDGASW
jgi:hypothetical protein